MERAHRDRVDAGAGASTSEEAAHVMGEKGSVAEVLAPGLVCLRRAIDLETQAWLAERAFEVGEGKDGRQGFYDTVPGDAPGDAPVLRLNQGTRGRVILPVSDFPETRAHRSRLRPLRADGGLEHERPRHEPDDRAGQLLQRGR